MNIGKLLLKDDGGNPYYEGSIRTLKLALPRFMLRRIAEPAKSPDAPKWEVVAKVGGEEINLGKAWEKELQRGDQAGRAFFSITLDDPSFDQPLYVNAFPEGGTDRYRIVWDRPRRKADDAPAGDDDAPY